MLACLPLAISQTEQKATSMVLVKLSKMYIDQTSVRKKRGLFNHAGRACEKVKTFWVQIYAKMEKILQSNITMKLKLFLLSFMDVNWKKKSGKLVLYYRRIFVAQG